jgi:N-acyl-D-aspartate/D-glutamate deacylase
MTDLDLIVRNGDIIDGSGGKAYRGDIGVKDGKIVAMGRVGGSAAKVIDAGGKIVSPGFVDVHTHYDAQAFWDPTLSPSCYHGVTTALGGNCGFSIAPLNGNPDDATYLMRMLSRVEGMPLESLKTGVPWNWKSFGEYLGRLDNHLAINAGFLVGHSALRRAVMGARAIGNKATPAELDAMKALLRKSLEEGGLGFSSSGSTTHNDADGGPVPSRYASTDEWLELAKVVSEFEGTYLEFIPELISGFTEETYKILTDMSLSAGRPLNWNVFLPTSANKEASAVQIAASDYAAERGARVLALAPPKPPKLIINLAAAGVFDAFTGWADTMALPIPERIKALKDPEVRRMLDARMKESPVFRAIADWSTWTVVTTFEERNKSYEKCTIGEVAARTGKAPFDAFLDLAISENLRTMVTPPAMGCDDESWRLRADAWTDDRVIVGGSDAGAHVDMIDSFAFSTQFLGEAVRERKLLPLEAAIHRITDVPARAFGVRGRGLLKAGNWADMVVFDPDKIGCGPVYQRNDLPGGAMRLYCDATGIDHVIVNGVLIISDNTFNGSLPGRTLRSGRDTYTPSLASSHKSAA